uniref:cyclase family protein n=1 Tax=Polaribacter sp. TaxID=1920175 RepID=UPI004047A60D
MLATIKYNSKNHQIDLSKPIDISIGVDPAKKGVNAWYIDDPKIYPVTEGDWVATVAEGASINFNMIEFNPHAHITHTECIGHITKKIHSVNKNLNQFFFYAELITIAPAMLDDDFVITKKQLQFALGAKKRDAVIIRTLPNLADKKSMRYSHSNPPYLLEEAAIFLREAGIEHLLIDLPSIDREEDEGLLLSHNAFWNTQGKIRKSATITEFIFVPNTVLDGTYFLNLMIAPFENDATPSKPILYELISNS